MTNYRSLVPGGFYSSDPYTKSVPVSIRCNNPGAVNGASWETTYPGYVTTDETTPGNKTTIFETPEHGVAVYWDLLRRYRVAGRTTVRQIITRYIGEAGAAGYIASVTKQTGLAADAVVNIDNDAALLPFAKAQFRHEAGKAIPWTDQQIVYGFQFARAHAKGIAPPVTVSIPLPTSPAKKAGWLDVLLGLFKPKSASSAAVTLPPTTVLKLGDKGPHVEAIQSALTDAGFFQYKIDGDFGTLTVKAVKNFQVAHNLDPDGEVGLMTSKELNARAAIGPVKAQPTQPGPSPAEGQPPWYRAAVKDIGFREVGVNRGIEKFITSAKTGSLGDPWCAIWINAKLEDAGIKGSRSAMARSFERSPDFVKLSAPAIGCIVTMWRGSQSAGTGHVFQYDGESAKGVRGIGANEDDGVRRSFHERARITGYWWPKSVPQPKLGKIIVGDSGSVVTSET